jgi:hypothetical protein
MYELPTELKISNIDAQKVATNKMNRIKFCLFQKSFFVNARIMAKKEMTTAKISKYTLYIIFFLSFPF